MAKTSVSLFTPYPFQIGETIRISDGPRAGDWQVIDLTKHKMTLKCPISKREFTWDRFCYLQQTLENETWPKQD